VQAQCSQCHGGSDQKRVDLTDLARLDYGDALECFQKVVDGEMPQGGQPLDNNGVALFRELVKVKKRSQVIGR
jgi:phage gp36-like protein